ncbi:hypothetical protein KUTeg_018021 [Tegillarca granosa]|uniref:Uncharacterized protein n=1 Tax=Tegillarca granosa TaxID=220873 RepID=A0ABQ9EME0_TEGGR|nr:hypothetical protein KUTeg_018021 [Tegillarca granosa]
MTCFERISLYRSRGPYIEVLILKDFLEQCRKSIVCYLSPNQEILTKPGGALKYALAGHKGCVYSITMKQDGVTAASLGEDSNIRIWNIQTGLMIKSLEDIGKQLCDIHYISNDTLLLVSTKSNFVAYREQGDVAYEIKIPDKSMSFCTAGKNNDKIVVFAKKYALIFDAENGKQIQKVEHHERFTFGTMCYPYGTENYVAILNNQNEDITVLNMKTNTYGGTRKGFPADEDGDYPTIDALAVTPDEKLIIYASCMDNDLHLIDIETLEDVRIIKGDEKDFAQNFHITDDGKYLYYPSQVEVIAYDLQTFEKRKFFSHDANLTDVQTQDFTTFVSITDDSTVRVWDITAIKSNNETNMTSQGFHPEENIKKIQPLSNGRYVFVVGHVSNKEKQGTYFYIFDIVKDRIVRKIKLEDPDHCYKNCELICRTSEQIVTQSRGRLFVKIYETATGKTMSVMKAGQSQRICTLKECVSSDGSVVAVMGDQTFRLPTIKGKPKSTDVNVVVLWNVNEGKVIQKLHDRHAMLQYHLGVGKDDLSVSTDQMICLDNKYIVTSHDDYKLRVWDLKTGKPVRRLDGHYTNTDLHTTQDSNFFISNASWDEEKAVRVWSTDGLLPTCSYQFDASVSTFKIKDSN